jgi:hypothetical protein
MGDGSASTRSSPSSTSLTGKQTPQTQISPDHPFFFRNYNLFFDNSHFSLGRFLIYVNRDIG